MRVIAALFGLLSVIAPQVSAQISVAHAVLHPFFNSTDANTISPFKGTVDFFQNNDGSGVVNITVKVAGLQGNKRYALIVHQYGNLQGYLSDASTSTVLNNLTLSNVGPHFNPFDQVHGCEAGNVRHAGDIGDVSIPDGTDPSTWVSVTLTSELLDLGINSNFSYDSIIGRAVVLREKADPCTDDDAQLGAYIALGVIGVNDTASKAIADTQTVDSTNAAPKATALIFNSTSQKPIGYINFWTDGSKRTHMSGVAYGFPPRSTHGIHIHAAGNEDSMASIAGHWTGPPGTTDHGLPPKANRHWGDLGNVVADSNGVITFNDTWASLNLISVWNSSTSILGRAVSIHEFRDDGTITTYGSRVGIGVIGLVDPTFSFPALPSAVFPAVARAQVVLRPFFNNSDAATTATWPDVPLAGNVTFTQNVDGTGDVNVTVVIRGLRGDHAYGLHVHDWGNVINSFDRTTGAPIITLVNLGSATDPVKGGVGGHFNPANVSSHGCGYGNPNRHAGDVGNVSVGTISESERWTFKRYDLSSELLDLGRDSNPINSIIGRTVSLHDRPNPCDGSTPLGNWIAIGVIGIDTTSIMNDKTQNVAQQEQLTFNPNNNSPKANAVIRDFRPNNGAGQIVGDIFFWSGASGEIRMGGAVAGFFPGSSHGVHIHQFGNENNNITIGPHLAAPGQDSGDFHQIPPYAGRHFGDIIATVTADANGVITFPNVSTGFDLLSLTNPSNSIIGHSIAFHEKADNGDPTSYGDRYRFGVIGLVHPDFPIPTNFSALQIPPAGTTPTPTATDAPTNTPTNGPGSNATTAPPTNPANATTAPPTNPSNTTTTPPTKPANTATTTTISHMLALVLALAVLAAK